MRNRAVNAYVYRVFSKQRYYNKYSKKVKRRRHVSRMTRRRRHSRYGGLIVPEMELSLMDI